VHNTIPTDIVRFKRSLALSVMAALLRPKGARRPLHPLFVLLACINLFVVVLVVVLSLKPSGPLPAFLWMDEPTAWVDEPKALAARKQIPYNAICNRADWPRRPAGRTFYNDFVEFNFTGKDGGLKRGVWLEYYISHSGAAAGDSIILMLSPKGQMGLFYSSPCWPVKIDSDIEQVNPSDSEFDQYYFSGMGGTSGWLFAYVLNGNSTVQSFSVNTQ
jgi:hypothetical protein